MKYFLICLLLSTGLLIQCANPTIRFNALYPAEIDIPTEIRSIAVIDRTAPENKWLSMIEGGITGEGIGQDKEASQITLDGVSSILQNSERFHLIRTNEVLKGSESGSTFPDPLSWEVVEQIAKEYEVDVVLSLESFDSDFIVTDGTRVVERKNAEGLLIHLPEFYARGVASVKLGFRLYDPVERSILDQYHFTDHMDWDASGNSVRDAINQLVGKSSAIRDVSYKAGRLYGQRITPSWYRVTRIYYKKAKRNPDLEEGARWMEANNWENAIESLEKAVENGDRKSRGMAAHNLAVVYEILRNLENARDWAQKAWAQYENRDSKDYAYQLNRRIQEGERLKYQMGE
jgi:hypothetical protein